MLSKAAKLILKNSFNKKLHLYGSFDGFYYIPSIKLNQLQQKFWYLTNIKTTSSSSFIESYIMTYYI